MKALLFALLASTSWCSASLVYAEYVITQGSPDNDPGLGNGVAINLPPNGDGTNLQFTVPPAVIASLPDGFYHLAVRAEDDQGRWCNTLSRTFRVGASPNASFPVDSPVERLEVFLAELSGDNDPGTGTGIAVDLGTPVNLLGNSYQFSGSEIAALPPGLDRLAARARNEAGLWSQTITRIVKLTEIPTPEGSEVRYRIAGVGGSQSGLLSNGPVVEFTESYAVNHPMQGLAPGQYTYYAEVVTGFGQVVNGASTSFQIVSHLDYWEQLYFTDPGERTDPDIAGPDADPNHDGISNLASFILGLDPENNASNAYGARLGRNNRGVAFVTLPMALPPGASVRVDGTPDLFTSFVEQASITPAITITTAAGITSDSAASPFHLGYTDLELTSDSSPIWQERGFYRFSFDYSGDWPYSFD